MSAAKRAPSSEALQLGTNVELLLKQKGWTQQRLEAEAVLSKGYASRLISGEKGDRTSGKKLADIARALGVTVEELRRGPDSATLEGFLGAGTNQRETMHPTPPPSSYVSSDPCPRRTQAAEFALAHGISLPTVARVFAMPPDVDRSVVSWIQVFVDVEERRKAAAALTPADGTPTVPSNERKPPQH